MTPKTKTIPQPKPGLFERLSDFAILESLRVVKTDYDGLYDWVTSFVEGYSRFASANEKQSDVLQTIVVAMIDATADRDVWRVQYPKYKEAFSPFADNLVYRIGEPASLLELFKENGPLHRLAKAAE